MCCYNIKVYSDNVECGEYGEYHAATTMNGEAVMMPYVVINNLTSTSYDEYNVDGKKVTIVR